MESSTTTASASRKPRDLDEDIGQAAAAKSSSYLSGLNQQLQAGQWREFVDSRREELLKAVDAQICAAMDELLEKSLEEGSSGGDVDMADRRYRRSSMGHNGGSSSEEREAKRGGPLPDKVFRHRQSVLTDLLQISHIRTVYHIFVAILIIFSLNTMVNDWVEKGGIVHTYHLELVTWAFGKVKDVVMIWLMMKMATIILVYPAFHYWSTSRPYPCPRAVRADFLWLALLCIYQLCFLIIPLRFIYECDLPPASSAIVVMEQIRMIMKSHAFIRSNVPKVLAFKVKNENKASRSTGTGSLNNPNGFFVQSGLDEEDDEQPCPNFSRYLYFLFAPTLVYRDRYPRSPSIRWGYVVSNFAQVFFCIVYMYYVFARFCFTLFYNFNADHVDLRVWTTATFGCMLPGGLVLLIGFFAILHSWFNAFAEMLRFGDRLFYKDWWNSTSFGTYYRTWNVVVHDWLYTYIYKEVYDLFGRRDRSVATGMVFFISAVFHEYVLTVSFRFFYPVLFIMFGGAGFGFIFIKGRSRFWNVALWVALFSGTGILVSLYSMEWYARRNCPVNTDSFLDYVIPRSWFCSL